MWSKLSRTTYYRTKLNYIFRRPLNGTRIGVTRILKNIQKIQVRRWFLDKKVNTFYFSASSPFQISNYNWVLIFTAPGRGLVNKVFYSVFQAMWNEWLTWKESRRQETEDIFISKNYLVEKQEAEWLKLLRIRSSITWYIFLSFYISVE